MFLRKPLETNFSGANRRSFTSSSSSASSSDPQLDLPTTTVRACFLNFLIGASRCTPVLLMCDKNVSCVCVFVCVCAFQKYLLIAAFLASYNPANQVASISKLYTLFLLDSFGFVRVK